MVRTICTPLLLALSVLAVLAACAGPVAEPATTTDTGPGSALASDSYQARLTLLDDQLAAALAPIRQARDPDTVESAMTAAVSAISEAGDQLGQGGPVPDAVRQANTVLADGLSQLEIDLMSLRERVHRHEVCTGPAAMEELNGAPSVVALRAIAAGLALPGDDGRTYRWGSWLQVAPGRAPSPLVNGTVLTDRRSGHPGDGGLEIRNDGPDDAVVLLSKAGTVLVSIAVSAGQSARVAGIPEGDYDVAYTTGRAWDPRLSAFGRACAFRRFTTLTRVVTTTAATAHTVTVRSGPVDAGSINVPPREFPR